MVETILMVETEEKPMACSGGARKALFAGGGEKIAP
jgi:hypothetical protein